MNLICMNMNMLAEHISRTHVWFRTKTRFDTGNRQLGVGLSLCSHCSFLLVQPTTKKIIISLHSRFFGEHDIGVYFNLISPLLSWLHNCNDQLCLHIFLRSSNMIFHIFTCILHYLRVYYELTKWPAPRWLDCSVGRALHRHRRTHGLESHSGQIFFGFIFTILLKLCA